MFKNLGKRSIVLLEWGPRGGGDYCKLLSVALPSLRHLPALLTVESSEERRFEEWGRVLGCQNLCSHFIPKLTAPAHTQFVFSHLIFFLILEVEVSLRCKTIIDLLAPNF